MYFYAHFYSVNPFECPKLIVGIVGIDGKLFFHRYTAIFPTLPSKIILYV